MNPLIRFRNVLVLCLIAMVVDGCAPALRMTLEHRDGAGNLVERFVVTPTDSHDVEINNFQASHTIDAFVDATFDGGLERVSIEVNGHCMRQGQTGNFGYVIPTTGNAIPAGQNPTKFSFNARIDTTCNEPDFDLEAWATATGLTKSGATATVSTKALILKK
jgi:hypothetical protein